MPLSLSHPLYECVPLTWGVAPALKGEKPALHQHSMSMKAVDDATLDYSLENDIWCGFFPTHHPPR